MASYVAILHLSPSRLGFTKIPWVALFWMSSLLWQEGHSNLMLSTVDCRSTSLGLSHWVGSLCFVLGKTLCSHTTSSVFLPDPAIVGIPHCNQIWPLEKQKWANLALPFYKAVGLTQAYNFKSHPRAWNCGQYGCQRDWHFILLTINNGYFVTHYVLLENHIENLCF